MKRICLLIISLCLVVSGCSKKETKWPKAYNEEASITEKLPFNPLEWRVVTSSLNRQESTMATLYGNDLAVRHARTDPQQPYPQGSTLSLVTWLQQDDEHWFGGRIPGQIKSIEFVTVDTDANQAPSYLYESYEGASLKKLPADEASIINARIQYILNQRASVMP